MFKSLRARLFLSHLVVIGLVFILTAVAAFVPLRRAQDRLEVLRLEGLATPLVVQTGFIIRRDPANVGLLNELLDLQAFRLGTRLVLFDGQGHVIHDTSATATISPARVNEFKPHIARLAAAEAQAARSGRLPTATPIQYVGIRDGDRIVLAAVPLTSDRVMALIAPVQTVPLLREILVPLSLASLVGLIGALLATVFLSRSIARPITRLTQAADAVAAGDLGRSVPGEGSDEVGRLVRSFNAMVSRLQAAYDSQRQLLANIAHELRTPLTSIQGYALALRDDVITDEAGRDAALQTISDEADRVNSLVVQILQLSRLESGQSEPHPTHLDLGQVLERVVRRHRVEADAAAIGLNASVVDGQLVLADEALIDQAIDNLVRNAIQHTSAGGRVSISAGPALDSHLGHPRLRIRVSDSGSGIPAAQIPYIFERFHRGDQDGAADVGRPTGFGLGLAIVREIVVAHGGSVGVESQLGLGTTFIIDLPLADAETSTADAPSRATPAGTAHGDSSR